MSDNWKHRLCYIHGCWAYFTTQDIKEQWGDDWDDAPYEHNAGEPYEPCWHNKPELLHSTARGSKTVPGDLCKCTSCIRDWNEDGTPRYSIRKLAWDGPLETPCSSYWSGNSPWSVRDINAGAVAWLRTRDRNPPIVIPAGIWIIDFVHAVRRAGGECYLPSGIRIGEADDRGIEYEQEVIS